MKKRKFLFNILIFACVLVFAKINVSAHEKEIPSGYTGIYTIDDLAGIENNTSGKYILMNDIDMTEATKKGGEYDSGMGWTPISEFSGVLDGNGYQIIGMNIYTETKYEYIGLIGKIRAGVVKNLGMKDVTINVKSFHVGGIAGQIDDGDNGSTLIENCYVSGEINNSYVSDYANACTGGIIGQFSGKGIIQNCFNKADITIDNSKCYYSHVFYTGGIAGSNTADYSKIIKSYSIGKVSYSVEEGSGGLQECSGISYGGSNENCFYLKDSVEPTNEIAGVKALTSTQMKHKQYFTNFDFDNTWEIDSYCQYPYPQLRNNRYIRVKELTLVSKPQKITYKQGEDISLDGASLKIVYDDGYDTTIIPTNDMIVSYDKNKIGLQEIQLRCGDQVVSFEITVNPVIETSVKLNASNIDIKKGTTKKLNAIIEPENASYKTVTWTSEDPSIATVDEDGNVTGKSAGKTEITATTVNGLKATCIVNVKIPAIKIFLNHDKLNLLQGTSEQLIASISPVDSTDQITWASDNKKIADVIDGTVIAKSAGTTKIHAKAESGVEKICTVTVKSNVPKAKSTKLKKVTALKKKMVKVQFNAVKGMEGYQIQYAKKRNFKGAKTVKTRSTLVKIKKLQAKKKYFFRVRTYVKYKNKNIYSGWSNVKSVTTKK